MYRPGYLLLLALALPLAVQGQSSKADLLSTATLQPSSDPVATTIPTAGLEPDRICQAGIAYLRAEQKTKSGASAEVIYAVKADGSTVKNDLRKGAELPAGWSLEQYAADYDGNLFAMLSAGQGDGKHWYVAGFSGDGGVGSAVELPASYAYAQSTFVPLPSGRFVMTAQEMDKETGQPQGFVGLFDSDGSLMQKLDLPGMKFDPGEQLNGVQTRLHSGPEGNVFVVQPAEQQITVVTERGEQVRAVSLGGPNAGGEMVDAVPLQDKFLVEYLIPVTREPGKKMKSYREEYWLYNGDTGMAETKLEVKVPENGELLCFGRDQVSFLVPGKNGKYAVAHADMP